MATIHKSDATSLTALISVKMFAFLLTVLFITIPSRSCATVAKTPPGTSYSSAPDNPPVAPGSIVISEFMASNKSRRPLSDSELLDEQGRSSDWIELHNTTAKPINLTGWFLSDDPNKPDKWRFPQLDPPVTIVPHGYLVVFASGRNIAEPNRPLHTNFKLSSAGESLALVMPDADTVSDSYAPYPPQFGNISYGKARDSVTQQNRTGYFAAPTPGRANTGLLNKQLGPVITAVTHTPTRPDPNTPLIITANIQPRSADILAVHLNIKLDFLPDNILNNLIPIMMADDGNYPDRVAGDNIYTTVVDSKWFLPGHMVRYYIAAIDINAEITRFPAHLTATSPAYCGTVVADPAISADIPVFYWFVEKPERAATRSGTRCCVFYNGEFYDNVFVRLRGGATVGKQSKKYVFHRHHRFRFLPQYPRADEINLNARGSDPTYLRPPLAFETIRLAGCPASVCFPMLSVLNGKPERIAVFVEQVDERFLERNGFDPDGALYKFVQRRRITPVFSDADTGIEKKTRKFEDFNDVRRLVDGINTETYNRKKAFVFDNFNIPEIMNYLAARALLQDTDDIRKNFYFYRDTNNTELWSIFPWDKDWTFGITGNRFVYASHPYLGDANHPKNKGRQWSNFFTLIYNLPDTQEMFLRRLRSVMDQLLQEPNTPDDKLFFENRVDQFFAGLYPCLSKKDSKRIGYYVSKLKDYFPQRRIDLYISHSIHNLNNTEDPPAGGCAGIPDAQPEDVTININSVDYDPDSGDQDQEYIELINNNDFAVDISGWKLTKAVKFTFAPGTVIIAHGRLYVTPDVRAFRKRRTPPTGGMGLFVTGPYKGHLSAKGESIVLKNSDGKTVTIYTYTP